MLIKIATLSDGNRSQDTLAYTYLLITEILVFYFYTGFSVRKAVLFENISYMRLDSTDHYAVKVLHEYGTRCEIV